MCGFVQRNGNSEAVTQTLEAVGLTQQIPLFAKEVGKQQNFYPAFGKDPRRQLTNIIISPENAIDATWWFDCSAKGDTLLVGDRTTFNARNLDSPFWRHSINTHRGIVVATAIGESNKVGNATKHYLMEADSCFLLGAVYREFPNGCNSAAVITRPPHPQFSQYHEKSIPCFLPHDKAFIREWLSNTGLSPAIMNALEHPKIHQRISVTPVKTFKSGEAIGALQVLEVDSTLY